MKKLSLLLTICMLAASTSLPVYAVDETETVSEEVQEEVQAEQEQEQQEEQEQVLDEAKETSIDSVIRWKDDALDITSAEILAGGDSCRVKNLGTPRTTAYLSALMARLVKVNIYDLPADAPTEEIDFDAGYGVELELSRDSLSLKEAQGWMEVVLDNGAPTYYPIEETAAFESAVDAFYPSLQKGGDGEEVGIIKSYDDSSITWADGEVTEWPGGYTLSETATYNDNAEFVLQVNQWPLGDFKNYNEDEQVIDEDTGKVNDKYDVEKQHDHYETYEAPAISEADYTARFTFTPTDETDGTWLGDFANGDALDATFYAFTSSAAASVKIFNVALELDNGSETLLLGGEDDAHERGEYHFSYNQQYIDGKWRVYVPTEYSESQLSVEFSKDLEEELHIMVRLAGTVNGTKVNFRQEAENESETGTVADGIIYYSDALLKEMEERRAALPQTLDFDEAARESDEVISHRQPLKGMQTELKTDEEYELDFRVETAAVWQIQAELTPTVSAVSSDGNIEVAVVKLQLFADGKEYYADGWNQQLARISGDKGNQWFKLVRTRKQYTPSEGILDWSKENELPEGTMVQHEIVPLESFDNFVIEYNALSETGIFAVEYSDTKNLMDTFTIELDGESYSTDVNDIRYQGRFIQNFMEDYYGDGWETTYREAGFEV